MTSDVITYYPLSSVQKEIWFDQMLFPNSPMYNIGGYVLINTRLNPSLLEQAINFVVQQHETLRIVLHQQTESPSQEIIPAVYPVVNFYDFSWENDPHYVITNKIQEEFTEPFVLYNIPLYKFVILKARENSYYLVHKYHHLIADGWTMALVMKYIVEVYNYYIVKEVPQKENFSYVNYIYADQTYLTSKKFQQDRQYWLDKYKYLPVPLFPRKTAKKNKSQDTRDITGQRATLLLSRSWYEQCTQFSLKHNSSPFVLILALLYCYFVRTTQNNEFCIGIALLNRANSDFKHTVGLFSKVIPVWFKFGTELTLIELMGAINQELRHDYRHQHFPLSEINRNIGIFKQGRTQLFDITLSFLKEDYTDLSIAGVPIIGTFAEIHNGFNSNPLEIFVEQFYDKENVSIHFDYNLAFFNEQEIEQLKTRFLFLLQEVVEYPDTPIWKLEIVPPLEKYRILHEFNKTTVDYQFDKTVIDLFEQQAEEKLSATAVILDGKMCSYQKLNENANQLAHYLRKLGVGPEVLVGICLERSIEMVAGVLAILKAGGAYVPLDPHYPQERLHFMLQDSGIPFLVTSGDLHKQLFPDTTARVICIDEEKSVISQYSIQNPSVKVLPENLAYLIYTSGSTGKPKGVLIEHFGLYNFILIQTQYFNVSDRSKILQFFSLNFDGSVHEVFMALCLGVTLCLIPSSSIVSQELDEYLRDYKVTHAVLPPSILTNLPNKKPLPHLTTIIVAGEACPASLLEKWATDRQFFNAYGPTETTICATIGLCKDNDRNPPIGRPIPNVQIYILDAHLQPVPIGVSGELCIGGVGLARGYLNQPELTAKKFIPHPFSDKLGARIYKTGDLARYLPDGTIEYLGRIDTQVKIRGFRIELGEIESTLKQHAQVHDAVVIVYEDAMSNKQLIAYYISEQEISPNELRNLLKKSLPSYMLPSIFMQMDSFPLSPNGKIDRRAFPQPDRTKHAEEKNFVAPRSHIERVMTDIWSRSLGVEHIGIYDNFFELGGHSISATHILAAIQEKFNVELPLHYLFDEATIASLSQEIEIRQWAQRLSKHDNTDPSLEKTEQEDVIQKEGRTIGKL